MSGKGWETTGRGTDSQGVFPKSLGSDQDTANRLSDDVR